jgi:CRP/FNR family transcriptional regulator, nitrogen oxide reductase regulator
VQKNAARMFPRGPADALASSASRDYDLGPIYGPKRLPARGIGWEPARIVGHTELATQRRTFSLECIRTSPLFADLPPSAESELSACATERSFASRETIFREDDPIRFVDVIATGSVKVTRLSREGSEVILRVERAGSAVDGLGAHYEPIHTTSAYAMRDCCILSWDAVEFASLAARHPILQRNAALVMTRRLQLLQDSFCDLSTARVPQRLARVLLRLAAEGPSNPADAWGLSREEMAQMTGTSLFTISRLLREWAERQIVYVDRSGVAIENFATLVRISEDNEESPPVNNDVGRVPTAIR